MVLLVVGNIISLLMMGLDKYKSIKRKHRIRESTFFGLTCLGFGTGVVIGMYLFNHKTKKPLFKIGLSLITLLTYLVIGWLLANDYIK